MEEVQFGSRFEWQRDLNAALTEIRRTNPSAPTANKTIYFVRHAESKSNVAKAGMQKSRLSGAMRLCAAGFDSGLSGTGQQQLLQVRPAAQNLGNEVQAVLYSPLERATQTALTLFGDEDGSGAYQPSTNKFWRPVRGLKETRFQEHAQHALVRSQSIQKRRVLAFIRFVAMLPWDTLALVGHSRFFRMMLQYMGAEVWIRNANVWRVTAEVKADGELRCVSKALIAEPFYDIVGTDSESDNEKHKE
mmetsp:Transcript_122441/g.305687  ORF Transcript_122441/g.305687 Transcript_122441/m.305687 type:complete len:247 (+) Transcript_122441:70-810(+)